jgi:NadR type nicotinamide-nucleotide adenylyltransferase
MTAGRPLRVAIVGASMSGKSTLAAQLAAHYGTVWVPEYLREFVDARGLPQASDQAGIARVQIGREAAALAQARGFLFCDTSPLMTAVYSRFYFGGIPPELEQLVQGHAYDHTLVCAPEWGWVPDGLHREEQDVSGPVTEVLLDELDKRKLRYTLVAGDSARRLMKVEQLLGKPVTVGK